MRAVLLIITVVAGIKLLGAQSAEQKLILDIGGGLPAARTLTVRLLATGEFRATGSGLPFLQSGLTKFEHQQKVSAAATAALQKLASQAAAEWQGTGEPVPDCRWATLDIQAGSKHIHVASGCISNTWVLRSSIKEFLVSLDRLLPPGWTVSEVIGF